MCLMLIVVVQHHQHRSLHQDLHMLRDIQHLDRHIDLHRDQLDSRHHDLHEILLLSHRDNHLDSQVQDHLLTRPPHLFLCYLRGRRLLLRLSQLRCPVIHAVQRLLQLRPRHRARRRGHQLQPRRMLP